MRTKDLQKVAEYLEDKIALLENRDDFEEMKPKVEKLQKTIKLIQEEIAKRNPKKQCPICGAFFKGKGTVCARYRDSIIGEDAYCG